MDKAFTGLILGICCWAAAAAASHGGNDCRVRALADTESAWSETIEVTTTGEKPLPVPNWSEVESVTTAAVGKPDEIPIDSETFPTLGLKDGLSGSADTVFASDFSDVEAIYAVWNGTEWEWATDGNGELVVLPNEDNWPTVRIPYPEGVDDALLRLRFIPKDD